MALKFLRLLLCSRSDCESDIDWEDLDISTADFLLHMFDWSYGSRVNLGQIRLMAVS